MKTLRLLLLLVVIVAISGCAALTSSPTPTPPPPVATTTPAPGTLVIQLLDREPAANPWVKVPMSNGSKGALELSLPSVNQAYIYDSLDLGTRSGVLYFAVYIGENYHLVVIEGKGDELGVIYGWSYQRVKLLKTQVLRVGFAEGVTFINLKRRVDNGWEVSY